MGVRPIVLVAVVALALPLLMAGTASAVAVVPTPRVAPPFRLAIQHWPVPVSGVVAVGPPPAGTPSPIPPPGLGVIAPVVILNLTPIGAQYRVTHSDRAQNEVSVAVNPRDARNIVVSANDWRGVSGDAWCGVYATKDGGFTWTEQLVPRTGPFLLVGASGDPSVAFDADGNVYQGCLGFNRDGSENIIAVSKSTDGGITWQTAAQVAGTTPNVFHDKPYMGVDRSTGPTRGNVYVTWTRFLYDAGGNYIESPIYFSRSTDGGLTFSAEKDISGTYRYDQGSQPVTGPAGELYVSWVAGAAIDRVVFTKSLDAGLTWTSATALAMFYDPGELYGGVPRTPHFPSIVVNPVNAPTGNRVHVVWADRRWGDADIAMSSSSDGGATWSIPLRVNDDAGPNAQFFPWVSASETGRVDIEFYDRRDDPADRLLVDYVASSFDFGATIAWNLRASAQFDPGDWFIGDYNGIASQGAFAYPGWCDLRNDGELEIYIAGPPMFVKTGPPSVFP